MHTRHIRRLYHARNIPSMLLTRSSDNSGTARADSLLRLNSVCTTQNSQYNMHNKLQQQLECARDSAYLHQANFYRCPFLKNFWGVTSRLSLETCMSNLKSIALTVLELLALNAQIFRESRDPSHAPFTKKFLWVMSGLSLGTCMSNLKSVALTVLNWSDWPVHCAHRYTYIERTHYLRHSLRSPGGDNNGLST